MKVRVKPRREGEEQDIVCTAVTGVYKTLLSEGDWSKLKMNNQNLELRKVKMVFTSYSAWECEGEDAVSVVKGQQESLLGRVDTEKKLGIITIRHEGKPGTEDTVRHL